MRYNVEILTSGAFGWLFWCGPMSLEDAQLYVEECRKFMAGRGDTGVEYRIVEEAA